MFCWDQKAGNQNQNQKWNQKMESEMLAGDYNPNLVQITVDALDALLAGNRSARCSAPS